MLRIINLRRRRQILRQIPNARSRTPNAFTHRLGGHEDAVGDTALDVERVLNLVQRAGLVALERGVDAAGPAQRGLDLGGGVVVRAGGQDAGGGEVLEQAFQSERDERGETRRDYSRRRSAIAGRGSRSAGRSRRLLPAACNTCSRTG